MSLRPQIWPQTILGLSDLKSGLSDPKSGLSDLESGFSGPKPGLLILKSDVSDPKSI